jgi:hypothetical protein
MPNAEDARLVRTDFSDDPAWLALRAAILDPAAEFRAYVDIIDDPRFDGVTPEQAIALLPPYHHFFLFLVDPLTLSHPEHPILVVELRAMPGRTFRVTPGLLWAIENNLSIANMDFDEFLNAAAPDGIFRGFDSPDAHI